MKINLGAFLLIAAGCSTNDSAGGTPDGSTGILADARPDAKSSLEAGSTDAADSDAANGDDGSTTCDNLPPSGSLGAQSLQFTTLHLGDADLSGSLSSTAWASYGYNLDGLCTTATSKDVCALVTGASASVRVDGAGGIDNSWGANIVPLLQTASGVNGLSTAASASTSYLVVDSKGKGGFAYSAGGISLVIPLLDTHVVNKSGQGTIAGVIDTEGFISNLQAISGSISLSLCSGSTFAIIATQIREANDILLDGTNTSGASCTGISFGIAFEGATAYSGSLPGVTSTCPDM